MNLITRLTVSTVLLAAAPLRRWPWPIPPP